MGLIETIHRQPDPPTGLPRVTDQPREPVLALAAFSQQIITKVQHVGFITVLGSLRTTVSITATELKNDLVSLCLGQIPMSTPNMIRKLATQLGSQIFGGYPHS